MAARIQSATGQAGVALAIVVWFIAGMSLLVAGIVAQARVDTHMTQTHLARAKAVAAGDGAIQLMMVEQMNQDRPREQWQEVHSDSFRMGELAVNVVLLPTGKLVDLNGARAERLAKLFTVVAEIDGERARYLAENVLKSRTTRRARGTDAGGRLQAIEDLLRVEGVSRTLLDAIRDFIVVGRSGQGAGAAGTYRADAIVSYGDKTWLRRRWVALGSSTGTALPWHFERTEPPRVVAKESIFLGGSLDD